MSAFLASSPRGVSGTCIGQLWTPSKGAKAQYDKATVSRNLASSDGVVIIVTDESMTELRKTLDELGFVSFGVDDGFMHHSIDPGRIVTENCRKVYDYLMEGYNKSIEEGRKPGEIRVGDKVWYSSGYWYLDPNLGPQKAMEQTHSTYRYGTIEEVNGPYVDAVRWKNGALWNKDNMGRVDMKYFHRVLREYE